MSIIAWDGTHLVVDRMISYGSVAIQGHKCRKLKDGTLLAWSGNIDTGLLMAQWFENGADPDKFPVARTEQECWGILVVVDPYGKCSSYSQVPLPLSHTDSEGDEFMAWGSGMLGALCAMRCGATAVEAVSAVCTYHESCGMGMDILTAARSRRQ